MSSMQYSKPMYTFQAAFSSHAATGQIPLLARREVAIRGANRAAYTIAELMVLMAVIAIGVAVVVEVRDSFTPRFIQSISLTANSSRAIAALNDGSVLAWDTTTGEQHSLRAPSDNLLVEPTISPDGKLVARIEYPQPLVPGSKFQTLLKIADLDSSREFDCGPVDFVGRPVAGLVEFSRSGDRLAIVDEAANQVRIVDPRNPSVAEIVLQPLDPAATGSRSAPFGAGHLAFSPDGQSLYVLTLAGQLAKWDLVTGTASRISLVSTTPAIRTTYFAMSPDGRKLAVANEITTAAPAASTEIDLYDTDSMTLLRRTTISKEVGFIGFCGSGSQLAIAGDGTIEIWDAESFQQLRAVPATFGDQVAVSADGTQLALSDDQSVYLLEGSQLRKLGGIGSSGGSLFYLILAFVLTFALFSVMRKRRKMKTCVDCGKRWQAVKRGPAARFVQCPDCRLEHLPSDELRGALAKQNRLTRRGGLAAVVLLMTVGGWMCSDYFARGAIGFLIAFLLTLVCIACIAALIVGLGLLLVLRMRWRLRRLKNSDYAQQLAQKTAASEGRVEQVRAMAIWTDLPLQNPLPRGEGRVRVQVDGNDGYPHPNPLPKGEGAEHALPTGEDAFSIPSAEVLAAHLDDCRRRLDEIIGASCSPLSPSQMLIFATTAAAQKFLPVRGLTNEMPAVFCGPWANVGCISLEGMRKQLRPLLSSIRSLFSYQSVLWPRYGFGLGYALHNYVARTVDPTAIDACRRRIAVWAAEGSLLPLAEVFRRRLISTATSAAKNALPENYERNLRRTNQWLSLMDYFCGNDATPERQQQFQRLWQAAGQIRKFEVALQEACGCSLAEFESQWKTWAATASFGPPTVPPLAIAEVARNEIIPVIRNATAPLQRRIKAMRILGNCGWSIGVEVLLEMFAGPQPDLQREALAALRQLSGRLGTERAEDWQPWLASLPTAEDDESQPTSSEDKFGLKTVS